MPLITTAARRPTSRAIKAGEEVGRAKSLSALHTATLVGAGALHPEALSRVENAKKAWTVPLITTAARRPTSRAIKTGEEVGRAKSLSALRTATLGGARALTPKRCPGWDGLKPEEEHPRQAHEERKEGVDCAAVHHLRSPPYFPRHQGGRGSGASKISLCASHCNSRGSWRAPPRSLVPGGERKEDVDRAPDHHRRSPSHFPRHQDGRGSGASKISLCASHCFSRGRSCAPPRGVAPDGTDLSPKKSLSPRWRHNTIGDVSPEAYEVTLKIHLRSI